MKRSIPLFTAFLVLAAGCVTTKPPVPAPTQEQIARVETLLASEPIRRAFAHVDADREATLAEWRMLTEIEAPSGK